MTQPTQQQMLLCQSCGSVRVNGPWCYQGTPRLALVSIQSEQLLPCPVCALTAALQEAVGHIKALEAEMVPVVEAPDPSLNPVSQTATAKDLAGYTVNAGMEAAG